jgi:hypothetical protein
MGDWALRRNAVLVLLGLAAFAVVGIVGFSSRRKSLRHNPADDSPRRNVAIVLLGVAILVVVGIVVYTADSTSYCRNRYPPALWNVCHYPVAGVIVSSALVLIEGVVAWRLLTARRLELMTRSLVLEAGVAGAAAIWFLAYATDHPPQRAFLHFAWLLFLAAIGALIFLWGLAKWLADRIGWGRNSG